jgi:hypothetical protein
MPKPDLRLFPEVTTAAGVKYRWDGPAAADLARGITFNTKRGDGFAEGAATLARRIDRDYVDLNLFDDFALVGVDGSIAYEGRVTAAPRSLADVQSVAVQVAGWMSHAKDVKLTEIYVDRSYDNWQPASIQRRANLVGTLAVEDASTAPDPATGQPSLVMAHQGNWALNAAPAVEAWYDSGGIPIAQVYYAWKKNGNINAADTNWTWQLGLATDDIASNPTGSGNLRATGPGTGTLAASRTDQDFAVAQLFYANVAAGSANMVYEIDWTCLAVYGQHGLTLRGTADATNAQGVYAADVIRDLVRRWCPRLNSGGVQDTTFVIPHLRFLERTYPYDAMLEVNKYHNWDLAVWENKTVYFRPIDLSTYDWEVRLSDYGTTVDLQGDSTDNLANGIVVQYEDVATGKTRTIDPSTHPELVDTSPDNPANIHGLTVWTEIQLSTPTNRRRRRADRRHRPRRVQPRQGDRPDQGHGPYPGRRRQLAAGLEGQGRRPAHHLRPPELVRPHRGRDPVGQRQ